MKTWVNPLRKKVLPVIILLSMTVASSCFRKHWVEGNGHVVSQDRNTVSFHALESDGDMQVFFVRDSLCAITVEAEENLLPYIETEVRNETLHVGFKNHVHIGDHSPVKIFVYGPYLDDVKLSGSGKIDCDSLKTSNLNVNLSGSGHISLKAVCSDIHATLSGSGDIEMSGTTDESQLNISGSGNLHTFSLLQNNCYAKISGSGDIYVTVNDLLDATISGSGKVYYQGNPVVNTHITGSGSVIHY